MDVLVVSHLYPRPDDPVIGIFVHEQVKALQRRGHDVRVISPTPLVPDVPLLPDRWQRWQETPTQATFEGVDVHYSKHFSLPSRHTLPVVAFFVRGTLANAFSNITSDRDFSPEIIHAHVPLPDGYSCIPISDRYDIPLVTSIHGANIHTAAGNPISRKQISRTVKKSNTVTFNSEVLKSLASKRFSSISNSPILHNGVPMEMVNTADQATLPDSFDSNRLVVTSVGSITRKKGQRRVLEAIKKLPEEHKPNYLVVGDGPLRSNLEKETNQNSSYGPVHFTGAVPHSEVFSLLKSTDIMALPSTQEAFGIAYIEAMACGCTVIGCQGEGPSEFIEDGKTGFLVPKDSIDPIARILEELSNNREQIGSIGNRTREYVTTNLTWGKNAEKIEEIFRNATENP